MTGKTLIKVEGAPTYIDIYNNFGIYITYQSFNDLLSMPKFKNIETNDWAEYDGVEVLEDTLQLDIKDVTLNFATTKGYSYLQNFINYMKINKYYIWNFANINRIFKLRYVDCSSITNVGDLYLFTCKFSDDFPFYDGFTETPASINNLLNENFKLNNFLFSQFDIIPIKKQEGHYLEIKDFKERLLRNIPTQQGVIYDYYYDPQFQQAYANKSKELKLDLLMRSTLSDLWTNYKCFFHLLTKQLSIENNETRTMTLNGKTFSCYYIDSNVNNFYAKGMKSWLDFSVRVGTM